MAMERNHNDPFTYEIVDHLLVIAKKSDGWSKELNLVSWNGQQPPKFDIREWSPDHTKMSKGITLYDYEMRKVYQAYMKYSNARTIAEGRNNRNAAAEAGLRAGAEAAHAQEEAENKARQAMANAEAIRSQAGSDEKDDFDAPGLAGELHESESSATVSQDEDTSEEYASLNDEAVMAEASAAAEEASGVAASAAM